MHAETMLLIDDCKAEIVEDDAFLKQSMGAGHDIDRAIGESGEDFSRPAPLSRPVSSANRSPAASPNLVSV